MFGERLAPGPAAAGERLHLGRAGGRLFGRQLVLCRARLELVELELQLVEKPLLALRTLAEKRVPELLDHQLQAAICASASDACASAFAARVSAAASAAFSASISDPSGMPGSESQQPLRRHADPVR